MTRRYLFIHATAITMRTEFLCVWLGRSERDAKIFRTLTGLAAHNHDYFFSPWSLACVEFLERIAASLNLDYLQLKIREIRGSQLIKALPAADVKNLSMYS